MFPRCIVGFLQIEKHCDNMLSQYESFTYLLSTQIHQMGFHSATWNFFESGHGKGAPWCHRRLLKMTSRQPVECWSWYSISGAAAQGVTFCLKHSVELLVGPEKRQRLLELMLSNTSLKLRVLAIKLLKCWPQYILKMAVNIHISVCLCLCFSGVLFLCWTCMLFMSSDHTTTSCPRFCKVYGALFAVSVAKCQHFTSRHYTDKTWCFFLYRAAAAHVQRHIQHVQRIVCVNVLWCDCFDWVRHQLLCFQSAVSEWVSSFLTAQSEAGMTCLQTTHHCRGSLLTRTWCSTFSGHVDCHRQLWRALPVSVMSVPSSPLRLQLSTASVGWLSRFITAHQYHLGYIVPLLW